MEEKVKWDFSGYIRARMTQENNISTIYGSFSKENDNFIDLRSYLTAQAMYGPVTAVVSLDVAGDDFNDGAEWGYPVYTPGVDAGPGFESLWNVQVRHLYIQYKAPGPWIFHLGRIPAGLGHNILAKVNRDALRIIKPIGKHKLIFVAIKGANDRLTVPDSVKVGTTWQQMPAARDGSGDLNAFVGLFAYDTPGILNSSGQIYIAKQQNTREDPVVPQYPQKLFVGLSNDGTIGDLEYGLEAIYLGGKTALIPPAGLTKDKGFPKDYSAHMLYLKTKYNLSPSFMPMLSFGLGSGDDRSTNDKVEDFQALFLDETAYAYTNVFADDIHGFSYTDPLSVKYGSGFANVTWFQLGFKYLPLMDNQAFICANYTILNATEARTKGTGILGTDTGETTTNIGSEFDLNCGVNLTEKLKLSLNTGYFMPGDIFPDDVDNVLKIELFTEFIF